MRRSGILQHLAGLHGISRVAGITTHRATWAPGSVWIQERGNAGRTLLGGPILHPFAKMGSPCLPPLSWVWWAVAIGGCHIMLALVFGGAWWLSIVSYLARLMGLRALILASTSGKICLSNACTGITAIPLGYPRQYTESPQEDAVRSEHGQSSHHRDFVRARADVPSGPV